jgi:hypothetical protein
MQLERDEFGDLFDDLSQRAGAVDVLKDAATALLDVGEGSGLAAHPAISDPTPYTDGEDRGKQQADEDHMHKFVA